MPKPNTNPPCPKCGKPAHKKGKTAAGTQRFKCLPCKYYLPVGKRGAPLAQDNTTGTALTSTERSRRQRSKEQNSEDT